MIHDSRSEERLRGRTRTRGVWWTAAATSAAVVAAAVLFMVRTDPPPHDADTLVNPVTDGYFSDELLNVENPGYVGPDACRECHEERVEEFRQTNHFRTCRPAVPAEMPQSFRDTAATFATRYPGLAFEMVRQDDAFFQTTVTTTPDGPQRVRAGIDLIYGAGRADNIFFSWREDDRLFELPVAWLNPSARWASAHFDRNSPEFDFSRPASARCLECHNTWFAHVPGTANQFEREDFHLGVTCENCHGPGRDHVTFHRAHPDSTEAEAIITPTTLSREREIEVCSQCHTNALKHRGPAFRYRPGEQLADYYRSHSPRFPEDNHVANQIHSLRQSRCFQETDMTCVTCHDPHRPPEADMSLFMYCFQCHQREDCGDRDRLPIGVQDDCIGCHMPPRINIAINFQTETEDFVPPTVRYQHLITVYPEARREVLWEHFRNQSDAEGQAHARALAEELVEYWRSRAEDYVREYRFLASIAALREALRFDDSPELRQELRSAESHRTRLFDQWREALHQISQNRHEEAIRLLEGILNEKPNDYRAHGKLGMLYAVTGQTARAVEHLEAVEMHNPDDAYGITMLGWLAYLDGRSGDALEHFRRADNIEPFNAGIKWQTGLVLLQMDRTQTAIEMFEQALEIDPRHVESCLALSRSQRLQGMPDEALSVALRAVDLTGHSNLSALRNLAESYASVGDFDAAEARALEALELAQSQAPDRIPEIRELLVSYQMHERPRSREHPNPNSGEPGIGH